MNTNVAFANKQFSRATGAARTQAPSDRHTTRMTSLLASALLVVGVSAATAADYYSQNFDGMGTAGTTPPPGWSMWYLSGDSSSTVIPTGAEMATALPGANFLVVWNQTDGTDEWSQQAANMGSSPADPNRLLGTSPTASRGGVLQLSLTNTAGSPVTTVQVTYDMKCMAHGTLKGGAPANAPDELPGYRFYYLDGSTWTHVAALDLTNSVVNSVGHASGSMNFCVPVASGGTLQFRWYDDNADAYSPDTMYAIDYVVVNIRALQSGPQVSLVKAVKPSFTSLAIGTNYQLQVSADTTHWTNQGSPFTATCSAMTYPQYWDVDNWNQLFFRLQVAP
jgi:hypothetical protein